MIACGAVFGVAAGLAAGSWDVAVFWEPATGDVGAASGVLAADGVGAVAQDQPPLAAGWHDQPCASALCAVPGNNRRLAERYTVGRDR